VNITASKTIRSLSADNYWAYLNVSNNRACGLQGVRVYDLIPAGFSGSGFTTAVTSWESISGTHTGNATYWQFFLPASSWFGVNYTATGSGNYNQSDLYIFGADPP